VTSGTALLNLHPAVAEACMQEIPLIVISADRPQAWIGQQDGQCLPQPNVYGELVKSSIQLPEWFEVPQFAADESHGKLQRQKEFADQTRWYCNRIINEALLELNNHGKGPIHINVPISEPFFAMTTKELPEVRVIKRYHGLNDYNEPYDDLIEELNHYSKRMVVVGQMNYIYQFERKTVKDLYKYLTWHQEHIGNQTIPGWAIQNTDRILASISDDNEAQEMLSPDLLITYGGHIVSKRLKQFLRQHPPRAHWHVSTSGKIVDTFCCNSVIIEMNPFEFIEKIARKIEPVYTTFPKVWEDRSKAIQEPIFPYSAMQIVGKLIKNLPLECTLHLANSSAIRYAQLFQLSHKSEIYCNRGTSGIEGSLSTFIGFAHGDTSKLHFLIIGDLSFFYDMNALISLNLPKNIRILLINDQEGEIFRMLPQLDMSPEIASAVQGKHHCKAKAWATDQGLKYSAVHNEDEWNEVYTHFIASPLSANEAVVSPIKSKDSHKEAFDSDMTATAKTLEQGQLIEVFIDSVENEKIYKSLFRKE
ncbi:MAG: hypothetical protein WCR36_08855, partial [Bacteroidaceae bacterium]